MADYQSCTQISASCPVDATTYGYYPNFGANIFFLVAWGVLFLSQAALGVVYRTWSYSAVISIGAMMECLGYAGRIIMNDNPWSQGGFRLQIICLIMAPSFLAAGIYITIKHLVLYYAPELSRIKPHLYTWIFIGCDIGSIILQAMGGGFAASEGNLINVGNSIIVAGIAFQVATMAVCGASVIDFFTRVRKNKKGSVSPSSGTSQVASNEEKVEEEVRTGTKGKLFCAAMSFAFLTIWIRCIYRIPEMVGGWGNERMRNEKEFLILDGMMVLLATISMTVFHPGWTFPRMVTKYRESKV